MARMFLASLDPAHLVRGKGAVQLLSYLPLSETVGAGLLEQKHMEYLIRAFIRTYRNLEQSALDPEIS